MDRKMECPICKKKAVFVGVHDDEGNYHGLMGCEYENAPWSGLSYPYSAIWDSSRLG